MQYCCLLVVLAVTFLLFVEQKHFYIHIFNTQAREGAQAQTGVNDVPFFQKQRKTTSKEGSLLA